MGATIEECTIDEMTIDPEYGQPTKYGGLTISTPDIRGMVDLLDSGLRDGLVRITVERADQCVAHQHGARNLSSKTRLAGRCMSRTVVATV